VRTKKLYLEHKESVDFVMDPMRNPFKFLFNFIYSLISFIKRNPDVVITTGAGEVLFTCYLAKLFQKKVICIESISRINNPSNFGKLVYPIANLTIVQWKSLLKYYQDALYGGPIFDFTLRDKIEQTEVTNKIFIAMGTRPENFVRPLIEVDRLVGEGVLKGKVVAQTGHMKYEPKNYSYFKFCSGDVFEKYIRESEIIINGNGAGTISLSLQYRKPIILVPRKYELGEITIKNYDIAIEFDKMNLIKTVFEMEELYEAIQNCEPPQMDSMDLVGDIPSIIAKQIETWFGKEH
jgi:UDP-N-acetylglucosamine transferase subunit ALG13